MGRALGFRSIIMSCLVDSAHHTKAGLDGCGWGGGGGGE